MGLDINGPGEIAKVGSGWKDRDPVVRSVERAVKVSTPRHSAQINQQYKDNTSEC